jgi:hypothetical protein
MNIGDALCSRVRTGYVRSDAQAPVDVVVLFNPAVFSNLDSLNGSFVNSQRLAQQESARAHKKPARRT